MKGCATAIRDAVLREVAQRAQHLDAADDLGEVTVTVKLQAGTTWVRGVVWQESRVVRQRGRADV